MKAWTLNPPTQSPGDLQHSWAQTKDVDKDEEDKEDVDTEEASSLDETQRTDERRTEVTQRIEGRHFIFLFFYFFYFFFSFDWSNRFKSIVATARNIGLCEGYR